MFVLSTNKYSTNPLSTSFFLIFNLKLINLFEITHPCYANVKRQLAIKQQAMKTKTYIQTNCNE